MAIIEVTETGIQCQDFQTIYKNFSDTQKLKYPDLDTSETSAFYSIYAPICKCLSEMVSNSLSDFSIFNPDTTFKIHQDSLYSQKGLTRLNASYSTVKVGYLDTNSLTPMPIGTIFRSTNSSLELTTVSASGNSVSFERYLKITGTFNPANVYKFNIIVSTTEYNFVGSGTYTTIGELMTEITEFVDDLYAGISTYALDGYTNVMKFEKSNVQSYDYRFANVADANNKIEIYNIADCQYTEVGNINFEIGSITQLGQSQSALPNILNNTIYNFEASSNGRVQETDDEYRSRYYLDNNLNGYGNVYKIAGYLEQELVFVHKAYGYDNPSNATVDGLPPKSFEIVVDATKTVNNSEAIANLIFEYSGSNNSYGTESVSVLDIYNALHVVKFSYVEYLPIYFLINITELDDETVLPADYDNIIKTNILNIVNDAKIGKDVIPGKYASAVYSIDGVGKATIEVGLSFFSLSENILVVPRNKRVVCDSSKIETNVAV